MVNRKQYYGNNEQRVDTQRLRSRKHVSRKYGACDLWNRGGVGNSDTQGNKK